MSLLPRTTLHSDSEQEVLGENMKRKKKKGNVTEKEGKRKDQEKIEVLG
jgi:hypothetical protein